MNSPCAGSQKCPRKNVPEVLARYRAPSPFLVAPLKDKCWVRVLAGVVFVGNWLLMAHLRKHSIHMM